MENLLQYLGIFYIVGWVISFIIALPIAYMHYLEDHYILCALVIILSGPFSWINVYLSSKTLFAFAKTQIKYTVQMMILEILSDIEKARIKARENRK